MTDHILYTSSGGANEALRRTQLLTNNLANINTIGFHADYETVTSKAVQTTGLQTRTLAKIGQVYTDDKTGPISFTGRSLDVAIDGPGFIAVQAKNGTVGYTRAGNMDITVDGHLVTHKGELVLGQEGLISIPPSASVSIDKKGVVSAQIKGEAGTTLAEIGRIKLVNFDAKDVSKKEDGLFRPNNEGDQGNGLPIMLVPESLEGSNVDAVRALVELIDLSRQFDSEAKITKIAEENAAKANGLLNVQ